ncbi:MAG: M28 family peptidase [Limnothrix sp. RL_2_0]|nr:M28 family peptidase [Limnothrix sp. RL_2_0]
MSRRSLAQILATIFVSGVAIAVAPTVIAEPEVARQTRTPTQTVEFLTNLGARTPNSSASEAALVYLRHAYEQVGYETEVQTFQFHNDRQGTARLTVGETELSGNVVLGSIVGQRLSKLVRVAGTGTRQDFVTADVAGAIAIVERNQTTSTELLIEHAEAAGAVGLVLVQYDFDWEFDWAGIWEESPAGETSIPVMVLTKKASETLEELLAESKQDGLIKTQSPWEMVQGKNLIARSPNAIVPRIVIGAHYDSVPRSPGANDNASGTAVVLELAERLQDHPLVDWVWFVAFDAEEVGLMGARALIASLPYQTTLQGMVNFDMVGKQDNLLVSGDPLMTDLAKETVPSISVMRDHGVSDHFAFKAKDIPVLMITRGLDTDWHLPTDTTVEPVLLEETVDAAEQIIQVLLQDLLLPE